MLTLGRPGCARLVCLAISLDAGVASGGRFLRAARLVPLSHAGLL